MNPLVGPSLFVEPGRRRRLVAGIGLDGFPGAELPSQPASEPAAGYRPFLEVRADDTFDDTAVLTGSEPTVTGQELPQNPLVSSKSATMSPPLGVTEKSWWVSGMMLASVPAPVSSS